MVTPLSLAAAYGAIANGGELRMPRLIQEYLDSSGNSLHREEPSAALRVISPETARLMREYMQAVVTDGTGKVAKVPGYLVGGKTGTAQKVVKGQKGYASGKYIASFFGFLPARNPQAVIAVVVDEPRGAYYGAQVAGPIFQRIAQRLMWYWKVPPDDPAGLEEARIVRR
jgi:stage V sporulation protein D (sporulation-specific penicillin-binding protein)